MSTRSLILKAIGAKTPPQTPPMNQDEEDHEEEEETFDKKPNKPAPTKTQIRMQMEIDVSVQGPSRPSAGSNCTPKASNVNDPERSDVTECSNGSIEKDQRVKCQVQDCGKSFTRKSDRDFHVKMVHEKRMDFKCIWEGCGKKFGKKSNMIRHVKTHEGWRDSECVLLKAVQDKERSNGDSKMSDTDVPSRKTKRKRIRTPSKKSFKCTWPGCGKTFNQNYNLNKHVKNIHKKRRDFKCGVRGCGKALGTKRGLEKHMSMLHKNIAIEVKIPPQAVPMRAEENGNEPVPGPSRPSGGSKAGRVLRERTPVQKRSCVDEDSSDSEVSGSQSEPGDDSSSKAGTVGQSKTNTSSNRSAAGTRGGNNSRRAPGSVLKKFTPLTDGSLQCNACFTVFTHSNSIWQHYSESHQPPKFKCSEDGCGKKFARLSKLNSHVKTVHEKRKDFICPWEGCGRLFSVKSNMTAHYKNAHEGRKFKCPVTGCGKMFSNKHIKRHIKTHKKRKDFICEICGKAYLIKKVLQGHMRKHGPSV